MTLANPLFAPGFKTSPWWWEAAEPPKRDSVLPDHAGVAVVGGGYAGLSAALTLRRLGHDVAVLDAERIGWGASSRNGGMVSGGLKVASGALEQAHGKEKARAIADAAAASFPFIEETIAREGIDCDYVRCGRFVPAWTRRHYDALSARADFIAEVTGLPTRMLPRERQREALGSDHYHGGMIAEASGSLHPGKSSADHGDGTVTHLRVLPSSLHSRISRIPRRPFSRRTSVMPRTGDRNCRKEGSRIQSRSRDTWNSHRRAFPSCFSASPRRLCRTWGIRHPFSREPDGCICMPGNRCMR